MADTSNLVDEFDNAVRIARDELPNTLSNDVKSQIYGLYKQATEGDCTGTRPGLFQPTARFKYDAWKKYEGQSKEEARKRYISLIELLAKEHVSKSSADK